MPRLAALLITFCIGVAATLIWQIYGEMTGISSPQFAQQQLNAIALDVGAIRQNVDQLTASQERMAQEIAKLQAVEQDILQKISGSPPRSEAATERKPVPR